MDSVSIFLPGVAIPIIVTLVLLVLTRNAVTAHAPHATSVTMRYGAPIKLIGLLGFGMGLFLIAGPVLSNPQSPAVLFITAPMGIAMLFLLPETILVRHRADTTGVECKSLFRRPIDFKWGDIRSVEYNAATMCFVLRSSDGRAARISLLMEGMRGFTSMAVSLAPRSAFTDLAWKFANRVASGKLL